MGCYPRGTRHPGWPAPSPASPPALLLQLLHHGLASLRGRCLGQALSFHQLLLLLSLAPLQRGQAALPGGTLVFTVEDAGRETEEAKGAAGSPGKGTWWPQPTASTGALETSTSLGQKRGGLTSPASRHIFVPMEGPMGTGGDSKRAPGSRRLWGHPHTGTLQAGQRGFVQADS